MKVLKLFLFLSLLLKSIWVFAAVADQFNITFSKEEVISWEAVDVTIEAIDSNWNTVTDYTWNIIGFSETDNEATIPEELASDEWYTFSLSDEWMVKFENAVKFQAAWMQELTIYDINWEAVWIWKIQVVPKITNWSNEDIEILSPEDWLTIWKDFVTVSWESTKNHKILIVLNDKDEFTTITNSQWTFETEVSPLESWENLLQAYILDSDDNKIWESNRVLIRADISNPVFRKITLSPLSEDWEIEEWKNIIVNVFASKWLSEVSLVVNDSVVKLEETDDGVYVWNFNAPDFDSSMEENKYSLDLMLKDNLWHNTDEKEVATITINKVELPVAEEQNEDTQAENTDTEENNQAEENVWMDEFDITWLKLVKLKNKSILTWDSVEKADGYNVYKKMDENDEENIVLVETVEEPVFEVEITWDEVKYQLFAVKAFMKNDELEKTYEWNLSLATEIQTWPKFIILILISLLVWLGFAIIKRKQA